MKSKIQKTKTAIRQLKQIEELIPKKDLRLAAEWPKKDKWKILIATILSAQTRDEKTIEICEVLFKKYNSVEKLGGARLKEVEKLICSINYYKTKARHIRETGKIISKSGIPKTLDGLLELPGVGRKVGNVYLAVAENADCIGVDTHVARLSRKLGWTKNKDRYKIEKNLEKLFPKKYWRSINYILVRFGRALGKSRKREDEILNKLKKS